MGEARGDILRRLASGELALRDLAGLGAREIVALGALAQSQSAAGRHEDAARLYAALAALEPDVPGHLLSRAQALASAGRAAEAIAQLDAFLDVEGRLPAGDRARALLLRARLTQDSDPSAAAQALAYLQVLAEQSDDARAVLEGLV